MRRDMREGAAQMMQAMGLPHDKMMQRYRADRRVFVRCAPHFGEMIDDHVGIIPRRIAAKHDGGLIVQFQWIRHREDRPRASPGPKGLVVADAPIEKILVPRLLQDIGRVVGRRQIGGQPPGWGFAFMANDCVRYQADHLGLFGFGHLRNPFRVRHAVPDDLITARPKSRDRLRAVIVDRRIGDDADRQVEFVEQVEQPPHPDPVAVVAPQITAVVGWRRRTIEIDPTLAEDEMLQIDRDMDGEAFTVRPIEIRPRPKTRIGKPVK